MKLLLVLFVSSFISVAWGATAIELTDNSTDHPGYCYSKSKEVGAMEKDEIKTLKNTCVQVTCAENKSMLFNSCGLIIASPECKLTADLTKPYPDCCPHADCS